MLPNPIAIVRLLRPKQWIKNVFTLAGIIFGRQWTNLPLLEAVALTFVAFSLMGSSVYVINDYLDREADKAHPTKRHRPLASGVVTPIQGLVVALLCVSLSVALSYLVSLRVLCIVLTYLVINCAYSLRLKQLAVVDVFCFASGFMLRILAGTWGVGIPPSGWLILTGMFVTLFLGFGKRRAEWVDAAGAHARRRSLESYSRELLDTFLAITATGTVLSYGLYTLDAQTIALHHTTRLIYTLPFVLFGLFRYLLLLHSHNKGENPSSDVFTDPQIMLCGACFVLTVLAISAHL